MRSILFVPGDRSDRFPKALASGADAVCVDLEDGVAPPHKAAARQSTVAFLSQLEAARCAVFVRVNGLESPVGVEDLAALSQPFRCLAGLLLPKCTSSDSVARVAERLGEEGLDLSLTALIEDMNRTKGTGWERWRNLPFDPTRAEHVGAVRALVDELAANGSTPISEAEMEQLSRRNGRLTNPKPSDRVTDSTFGRQIHLRRMAKNARVTVFEGGHERIDSAMLAWLEQHVKDE